MAMHIEPAERGRVRIGRDDPRENPGHAERGQQFHVHYDSDAREAVVAVAIADAVSVLPPQTVFDVRAKLVPRDRMGDFGRRRFTREELAHDWAVAWYTNAHIQSDLKTYPLVHRIPIEKAVEVPEGGYMLIARMVSARVIG